MHVSYKLSNIFILSLITIIYSYKKKKKDWVSKAFSLNEDSFKIIVVEPTIFFQNFSSRTHRKRGICKNQGVDRSKMLKL